MNSQIRTVAARFNEAMERRDADLLALLYCEDAVIWHSHDEIEQSKSENIVTVRNFLGDLSECKLELKSIHSTGTGFVQEHQLSGRYNDGSEYRSSRLCMIVTVRGEKIARIDEYVSLKVSRRSLEGNRY